VLNIVFFLLNPSFSILKWSYDVSRVGSAPVFRAEPAPNNIECDTLSLKPFRITVSMCIFIGLLFLLNI
jgi:hypothetical protein